MTIPAAIRRRLGLRKGDIVTFIEPEDGVLITRRELIAARALEKIGEALTEKGISLEDLIDTNVLVYAHDVTEPARNEQANQVLDWQPLGQAWIGRCAGGASCGRS